MKLKKNYIYKTIVLDDDYYFLVLGYGSDDFFPIEVINLSGENKGENDGLFEEIDNDAIIKIGHKDDHPELLI
jgi:hypothetical protein